MLSAILTVSGQDTGATLFGPSDMQISVSFNTRTLATLIYGQWYWAPTND